MTTPQDAIGEAAAQLALATAAKKCWHCGCLHQTLSAIERAYPEGQRPEALGQAVGEARKRLTTVRYDCIGCDPCYPAVAVNALQSTGGPQVDVGACATEPVEVRAGWPPLPGSYVVKRYTAPVAVCTLTDEPLMRALAAAAGPEVAILGTCQTENLGLERLITNAVSNPNIRAVVLCGEDSRQAIGHRPGQSLLALVAGGVDEAGRIVGALGKRPVLKNVPRDVVEHFRRFVQVVDLVGRTDTPEILAAARAAASAVREPAPPLALAQAVQPIRGTLPDRMVPDHAGYFVLDVDRARRLLRLEHYTTQGVLDVVIEGDSAAELYCPAIERGLLSRLDHAAYLGRELSRAERALASGEAYVQDAAPEQQGASPGGAVVAEPTAAVGQGGRVKRVMVGGLVAAAFLAGMAVSHRSSLPSVTPLPATAGAPAPPSERPALGVDAYMRGVDDHPGEVVVFGVVCRTSPAGIELVDAEGCGPCAGGDCAPLVLPVRWSGAAAPQGTTVRVKGRPEEEGGRLVFVASSVAAVTSEVP